MTELRRDKLTSTYFTQVTSDLTSYRTDKTVSFEPLHS